jgi:hypothetical protein
LLIQAIITTDGLPGNYYFQAFQHSKRGVGLVLQLLRGGDLYEVNLGKDCHEISLCEMDYDIDYKEGGLPCPMLIIVIVQLLTHTTVPH